MHILSMDLRVLILVIMVVIFYMISINIINSGMVITNMVHIIMDVSVHMVVVLVNLCINFCEQNYEENVMEHVIFIIYAILFVIIYYNYDLMSYWKLYIAVVLAAKIGVLVIIVD